MPSPDGRYIAWLNYEGSKNTGGNTLALHDLVTGQGRNLTRAAHREDFAESPTFTPDGWHVVYMWFDRMKNVFETRMIAVDGSNERRLFDQTLRGGAISPDGRVMATIVQPSPGNRQLALANLTTGAVTILKTLDWREPTLGNFSPDGKYVVYSVRTGQDSQDRDVYAMAVDTSTEVRLVEGRGENRKPLFTPDGQHVVFVSNRSARWDLWAVGIAGAKPTGQPVIIKPDVGSVSVMGFTRDGSLFYSQQIDESDAFEVEVDPATLRATGTPKRISDRFVHSSADAHWSPDGQVLAYIGWRGQSGLTDGGHRIIVTRDATGREQEITVPMQRVTSTLRWFPDKKSVLFADIVGGRRQFRQVDIATREVRTLFDSHYSPSQTTTIASDSRSVLFTETNAPDRTEKRVVRYDIDTRERKNVYVLREPGVPFHGFSTSPDGRRMAFKSSFQDAEGSYNWRVMVADLLGGDPRELWRMPTRFVSADAAVWTADGRGLLVSVAGSTSSEIWFVPLDGGTAHSIGVTMPSIRVTDAHPDGRRVAFTSVGSTTHVWALRNLFPATRASQ